ncbi:hypothetical protein [Inhella proteolytica]|uniref:Uncharacterized protein n=1 Tax=Inhella proteolytica TaxID=2795029 RepID=A0A931J4L8_9BURK|nr:hypothetical protein [Inhella proteolytica]MBH9576217.1 hypothetical protein [Inhella proteolytica]
MHAVEEGLRRAPIASTVRMLLQAQRAGRHVVRARCRAQGDGHGAPEMWLELFVEGQREGATGTVPWQRGLHELELSLTLVLEAGDSVELLALSGHRHASACSIELDAIRSELPASLCLAPDEQPAAMPT